MSCTDCESNEIKYKGDGSQTLFTFPFTYIDETDLKVSLWDEPSRRWVYTTDYALANATTIQFNTAPPPPGPEDIIQFNIRIGRCTSIDPLSATFYPGSAIRAQDLNDNFDQLQLAIQEGRCQVPDWLFDYLDKLYWNKLEETIYTGDEFLCDDEHVASSGAICDKIDKEVDDLRDEINARVVTEADQKAGRWQTPDKLNDDDKLASTAAISERHDAYFQDNLPSPTPTYRQPGRRWVDTENLRNKTWDQQGGNWLDFANTGPKGDKGDEGTYSTIISENEPAVRNNGYPLQDGDLWFNTRIAELFIWYDDGTSKQWVNVVSGIPGPIGNPGPEGPEGPEGADGASIWVGDDPPEDITKYLLWFKTTCPVGLYGWHENAWVATSIPGPAGPEGTDGASLWINDDPPADTTKYPLWFKTTCDVGLYGWHQDTWVATSIPGPAGPAGSSGSTYTFSTPLVESTPGGVSFDITTLSLLN